MRLLVILGATLLMVGCAATGYPSAAVEPRAWDGQVQAHGALRAMFHEGKTGPMVSLDSLLPNPELYAVGALADLSGEVTVIGGRAYLAFPEVAGGARTELSLQSDAEATLLVSAAVPAWHSLVTDRSIRFKELDAEIGRLAIEAGLSLEDRFPFLQAGTFKDLQWHVIDGRRLIGGGSSHQDHMAAAVRTGRDCPPATLVRKERAAQPSDVAERASAGHSIGKTLSENDRLMHDTSMNRLVFATLTSVAQADQFETHTIDVAGSTRTYHVHKPESVTKPLPLIVVLHGGGGNGRGLRDTYGFKPFINDGELIAIYPDSGPGGWLPEHVAFLDAAIDDVLKREKIDDERIFITGASRGGLMTFVATQESKHQFAAAGTVISSNLQGLLDEYPLRIPIDFAMIAGTDDPLMPYDGGWGAMRKPRATGDPGARVVPVEEMILALTKLNGISDPPAVSSLGNADTTDGCTNEVRFYLNRTTKRRVMLVKVIGGGHVVPGGRQYLSKSLIGPACSDFDHAAVMWDFFKSAGTGLPPNMVADATAARSESLDVQKFAQELRRLLDAGLLDRALELVQTVGDAPAVRTEADRKRLVAALERVLQPRSDDQNFALQQETLLTLARCGEPGGEALDRALLNMGLRSRIQVQATIYEALGLTGDARRLPQLVAALNPRQPEIATSSVRGLAALLGRTDIPLIKWQDAVAKVDHCHAELVRRTQEPRSYPPPPALGNPLSYPSRERVVARLPAFEEAQREFLALIRKREEQGREEDKTK